MKYRKDIDGLRALAVLSVIFFHLGVSWIKSGFLGVDIFFVISGYIITSMILKDLDNNVFSIKNFYLRRIRRILPALITVLLFSTLFAWLILVPEDLRHYSKSVLAVLGSVPNLFFFNTLSFGYFGTDASVIPLLHTWSLGIEEQFYIFWPAALIILFKSDIKSKQQLLSVSIASLILSIYFFYWKDSPNYYYFPLSRAFELLFGCMLAIHNSNRTTKINLSTKNIDILSWLSLALMLIPIFFIDVHYPNFWTILVCIGATLFIYAGSHEDHLPIPNKILSFKPIVSIGLISYSLYLWHWPMIAYANYLNITRTPLVCFVILSASFLLSILTYFLIEKPFRHKFKFGFWKSVLFIWLVPLLLAYMFFLKFGDVWDIKEARTLFNQGSGYWQYSSCFNTSPKKSGIAPPLEKCTIGTKSTPTKFLLVGDSHARADINMISVWLKNINESAYIVAQPSTLPIWPITTPKGFRWGNKQKRSDLIKSLISSGKYRFVILAGYWSPVVGGITPKLSSVLNLENTINFSIKNNVIPIVMMNTPTLAKDNDAKCSLITFRKNNCSIDFNNVKQQQSQFIKFINKLKQANKELIIIDPKKAFCDKNKCVTNINGTPLFADHQHLNFLGSQLIGETYIKKYGNPLTKIVKQSNLE